MTTSFSPLAKTSVLMGEVLVVILGGSLENLTFSTSHIRLSVLDGPLFNLLAVGTIFPQLLPSGTAGTIQ